MIAIMRPGTSIKAIILERAHRYERLALRARANPALARTGYVIATLFMILGTLDAISTNWALSVGGYEANGFMRTLQAWLGPLWFIPKMLLQALVAMMIIWSPNKPTIFLMILTCAWTASVVTSNFMIAAALS